MRFPAPLVLTFVLGMVSASPVAARQAVISPHGPLPDGMDCSACHTNEGWQPLRAQLGFEHGDVSGFRITGSHADAACASCHLDLRFDGPKASEADCAGCHADVHDGRMIQSCATCHDTRGFDRVDGEVIHARTSFPLAGAHQQVTCESCHANDVGGAFTALETDCVSCHVGDYNGAQTVDHRANAYPEDCAQCHGSMGWNDAAAFEHGAASLGFDLIGAHGGLRCASCHMVPSMDPLFPAADENDCVACHQEDYQREHGGSSFPTTCLACHTVDSWEVTDFDHQLTGFELLGRHARLECSSCHADGHLTLLFPAPTGQDDCAACHQRDYDDEHSGSGFPVTCSSCHGLDDWSDASFDHATTAFPLVGAHTSQDCVDCHSPPQHLSARFVGSETCIACHQNVYDSEHGGSGTPTTCLNCHSQTTWSGASFDHRRSANGFGLEGPHADAACSSCHTLDFGLKFAKPASQEDCVACHQQEYDANHAGSGLPTTCLSCHAQDRWTGAVFDHGTTTGFALIEKHAQAACAECHTVPGYALVFPKPGSQDDCASCHQGQYDTNHVGSGFPTTCSNCHGQTTWQGAVFDHGTSTRFALVGPHVPLLCTSCHAVPGYALLFPAPTTQDDCVACHQGEYDANHVGSSFPTTCLTCHSPSTWAGATLDHVGASGGFALLGRHAAAVCGACHTVPSYGLIFPKPSGQSDCVACHQAAYPSAHTASGFSTDCAACHTVDAWMPSTFDHDAQFFPIYSGKHRQQWNACSDCHTVPASFAAFTCLNCHEHRQAKMDDVHKGRNGYSYSTAACMSCHPRGR